MQIKDFIPSSLPLLNYIDSLYSLEGNKPFRNYIILIVQHLLGSSIPFFTMLEKGGVKSKDVYIVGKAYSSHPLVVNRLIQKGYRLRFKDVFECMEDQPYDSILEKHIIQSCRKLFQRIDGNKKGLIIDDGGKAIRLLHEKYPEMVKRFVCVEQTSRGARIVNKINLKCPVINVARSNAKTFYESPIIAKSMVDELINNIKFWKKASVFQLINQKVLLLGYGFIGENVANEFRKHGFNIIVYDSDKTQLQKAYLHGFSIVKKREKAYKFISILVGCTGTSALQEKEFQLLKSGTLLVNMASTDTEFSSWKLRSKGEIVYKHVLQSDKKYLEKLIPCHLRIFN